MSTAIRLHFQRRLGIYLRTNHSYGGSGKLTSAQRRRLNRKNHDHMVARRAYLAASSQDRKGWA